MTRLGGGSVRLVRSSCKIRRNQRGLGLTRPMLYMRMRWERGRWGFGRWANAKGRVWEDIGRGEEKKFEMGGWSWYENGFEMAVRGV